MLPSVSYIYTNWRIRYRSQKLIIACGTKNLEAILLLASRPWAIEGFAKMMPEQQSKPFFLALCRDVLEFFWWNTICHLSENGWLYRTSIRGSVLVFEVVHDLHLELGSSTQKQEKKVEEVFANNVLDFLVKLEIFLSRLKTGLFI